MIGCMVGNSLAIAPAIIIAQHCTCIDLDGPLLHSADVDTPLQYSISHLCQALYVTTSLHEMPQSIGGAQLCQIFDYRRPFLRSTFTGIRHIGSRHMLARRLYKGVELFGVPDKAYVFHCARITKAFQNPSRTSHHSCETRAHQGLAGHNRVANGTLSFKESLSFRWFIGQGNAGDQSPQNHGWKAPT